MILIVNEKQFEFIVEQEFNYHVGNLGDKPEEVKPHGSDNLIRLGSGRDTGHFGSGLYFSTYNGEFKDYENKNPDKPELIEIKNGVYRVDFDLYKNLYRVNSTLHGDLLFKSLKKLNNIFWGSVDRDGSFETYPTIGNDYLLVNHNFNYLGLKLPKYRDFIGMIKAAAKNMVDKEDLRSFSTRIMEYNGYNGVNVSGIKYYDNTLHGSVIYDIKKLSKDIKKVKELPFLNFGIDKDVL